MVDGEKNERQRKSGGSQSGKGVEGEGREGGIIKEEEGEKEAGKNEKENK